MAARLVVAAALIPLSLAFSGTHPLVAWSSKSTTILRELSPSPSHSVSLFEAILASDEVCLYDAVVIVEHPGLHASDLRTLPASCNLARSLSSSASSRQFEYVPPHAELSVATIAESLSSRCGSKFISFAPGEPSYYSQDSKTVFSITLPPLRHRGRTRKEDMHIHESQLSDELEHLTSSFPKHLVVYTGSPLDSNPLTKRQSPDISSPPPVRPALQSVQDPSQNTTLPHGGILKRYQLLTPGLITSLLVTFFILVPIVMVGFRALASIQSPVRSEAPKGFSATEKKVQ